MRRSAIYTFATVSSVLSKLGVADHTFAQAWWLALVVGLVVTVGTALTGLVDWLSITRGTRALEDRDHAHGRDGYSATVFFLLAALAGHGGYVDRAVTTGAFLLTLVGFAAPLGGRLAGRCDHVRARDARALAAGRAGSARRVTRAARREGRSRG